MQLLAERRRRPHSSPDVTGMNGATGPGMRHTGYSSRRLRPRTRSRAPSSRWGVSSEECWENEDAKVRALRRKRWRLREPRRWRGTGSSSGACRLRPRRRRQGVRHRRRENVCGPRGWKVLGVGTHCVARGRSTRVSAVLWPYDQSWVVYSVIRPNSGAAS